MPPLNREAGQNGVLREGSQGGETPLNGAVTPGATRSWAPNQQACVCAGGLQSPLHPGPSGPSSPFGVQLHSCSRSRTELACDRRSVRLPTFRGRTWEPQAVPNRTKDRGKRQQQRWVGVASEKQEPEETRLGGQSRSTGAAEAGGTEAFQKPSSQTHHGLRQGFRPGRPTFLPASLYLLLFL